MKKFFVLAMLVACLTGHQTRAAGYDMIPEYICDQGDDLYRQGKYEEALKEYKKALMIKPDSDRARESSLKAQVMLAELSGTDQDIPEEEETEAIPGGSMIDNLAQSPAGDKESAYWPHIVQPPMPSTVPPTEGPKLPPTTAPLKAVRVIVLDQELVSAKFPIDAERGSQLVIRGQAISRYLVTVPEILRVDKLSPDELAVTVNDFGYTFLHVWDARGRWTIEFLGIPPRPTGPTLDEEYRLAEETSRSFKLRYLLDWAQYYNGDDLADLERRSYNWNHMLTLEGETPYGMLDSSVNVRDLQSSTDLTYFTIGLQNGKLGAFEDFAVRAFDFYPGINNLAFSSGTFRGLMLQSPAFDKKVAYTAFWGREGSGKFGNLSPGLSKQKDSYLEGFEVKYLPDASQYYSLSAFHGYGSERPEDLNDYGYDFRFSNALDSWRYGYEIAYDSDSFSHLLNTSFLTRDFKGTLEFRDSDKDFKTMSGTGWRAGETGVLNTLYWRANDALELSSRLDVYKDSLFPDPEHPDRLNEEWSLQANYNPDDLTGYRIDYSLTNDLGKLSPTRAHNFGAGIYRGFDLWTRINTFLNYRHIESTFFSSHVNDYNVDKVILGVSLQLISDLFYYANYEFDWLEADFYGTTSRPKAFETGFDWNRRILESPFFYNLRFTYRNEEDTLSPVSFFAGEDYLEYYAELSYRPNLFTEAFLSARLHDVIEVENPGAMKRLEANIYGGLRFTWDTGFTWEPVGMVSGSVFEDTNGDGLRQQDERARKGIKVSCGKEIFETDDEGNFCFPSVKSRRTSVSLDTSSLPRGYVLTTPQIQKIDIRHGRLSSVYFGIASRTEIYGMVFVDKNRSGKAEPGEKGLKGITLLLEDGSKAVTDDVGRYFFRQAQPGHHKLKLQLADLPASYMPSVPVLADIDLTEGASYVYNFPLKEISE